MFFYESFPGRGLHFSMLEFVFQTGASFLSGGGGAPWGSSFNDGGKGFEKNRRMEGGRPPMPPSLWETKEHPCWGLF